MDAAIFSWVNGWPHWGWFDRFVLLVSDIEQREAYLGLTAVLVYGLVTKKHHVWQGVLILAAAFVLVDNLVWSLKPLIARPRPYEAMAGVHVVGGNAGGSSFPSSNAANVSVLFAFIYFVTRKRLALWAALIFLLGFFRVYKGIHYPGDIAGGWALGVTGAWLASRVYRWVRGKAAP